jgi:hypothetical protein
MRSALLPALLVASAPFALAACSGHAAGGAGEYVPPPDPNPLGNGSRLADLNDPSHTRPAANAQVNVTGVVIVANDTYDETHDGKSAGALYVEDAVEAPPPFAGIEVFNPAFSPPDLRVAAGDVLDVTAQYQEFGGPSTLPFPAGETLPELSNGTVTFRFEWTVPPPTKIALSDLLAYGTGRQWLGMLVTLENVDVAVDGSSDSAGRFSAPLNVGGGVPIAKVPTVTNALFALESSGIPMTAGSHFKSITGVVQYFVRFSIAPRSAADLVQ